VEINISSKRLQQEVIQTGLCTSCGMCIGLCPYIKSFKEKTTFIHQCQVDDGKCYNICPRGETDWFQMDQEIFGKQRTDYVLGNYYQLLFARAKESDFSQKGQYSGLTSALVSYAISIGEIEGAVLSGGEPGKMPEPTLATTREDVLAAAGSKYSAVPTLLSLNKAVEEGFKNLGVVGRPCQVLAARKMQLRYNDRIDSPGNKITLIIGLFCFWALSPEFYDFLAEKTKGANITSIDITTEDLVVRTNVGELKLPVDTMRHFIRPTCQQCFDPTSEFADLSIGSTEFDPGWNTLIVRTDKGRKLIEQSLKDGIIEVNTYPVERIPLLRQAVGNKKKRVIKEWKPSYLKINESYHSFLEEGGM